MSTWYDRNGNVYDEINAPKSYFFLCGATYVWWGETSCAQYSELVYHGTLRLVLLGPNLKGTVNEMKY